MSYQEVKNGRYDELRNVIVNFILTEVPYKYDFKVREIGLIDIKTGKKYSDLLKIYEENLRSIDESDEEGMRTIRDFFGISTQEDYDNFIKKYESRVAKILTEGYDTVVNTDTLNVVEELEKESKYVRRVNDDDLARERAWGIERGIEKGRAEGIEKGIEKGRAEGIEKGIEQSIKLVVKSFKDMNLENIDIITNLVNNFKLTPEQANRYLS